MCKIMMLEYHASEKCKSAICGHAYPKRHRPQISSYSLFMSLHMRPLRTLHISTNWETHIALISQIQWQLLTNLKRCCSKRQMLIARHSSNWTMAFFKRLCKFHYTINTVFSFLDWNTFHDFSTLKFIHILLSYLHVRPLERIFCLLASLSISHAMLSATTS